VLSRRIRCRSCPKRRTKPSVSNLYGWSWWDKSWRLGRNFRGYLCNVVQLFLSLEREPDRVLCYLLQADLEAVPSVDSNRRAALGQCARVPALAPQSTSGPDRRAPASVSLRSVMSTNAITARQPLPLSAGDVTSIQRGSLFHSPSIAPRLQRGLLLRFEMPGKFDTLPLAIMSRLHECDESVHAYSCR